VAADCRDGCGATKRQMKWASSTLFGSSRRLSHFEIQVGRVIYQDTHSPHKVPVTCFGVADALIKVRALWKAKFISFWFDGGLSTSIHLS